MLGKKQHGFTLTELMIVVAVLAILAGIAIPSYSHFTKKAQLRKAQSALLENAHALEQVYAQKKKFSEKGKGIIDHTKYNVGGNCKYDDKTGEQTDCEGGRLFEEVPGNKFKIGIAYAGVSLCGDLGLTTDRYCMTAVSNDINRESRYLILDHTGNLICRDAATDNHDLCKNF